MRENRFKYLLNLSSYFDDFFSLLVKFLVTKLYCILFCYYCLTTMHKSQMLLKYKCNSIRWILPKELAIGSIVYSCAFFKEINSDASFHVPEHCQCDLLYWPLHQELASFHVPEYCQHDLLYWPLHQELVFMIIFNR